MSTTRLGMHKLGYLRVSTRIPERNSTIQPRTMVWNNTVCNLESPWASNEILKKAERHICHYEWPAIKFVQAFLAGHTSLHERYQYLYMKNYKVVNTYHKAFCYLESVNTKWENLMIYVVNLTQCVSSGYCESWILSLPSSIKYSCCNAMQYNLLMLCSIASCYIILLYCIFRGQIKGYSSSITTTVDGKDHWAKYSWFECHRSFRGNIFALPWP